MSHLPNLGDLDDVLREIRDSVLLHPGRSGTVKIVIESETGEQLHVLQIDARCPPSSKPTRRSQHRSAHAGDSSDATSAVRGDDRAVADQISNRDQHCQQSTLHSLLQRCNEQQQRIAQLEQRLQQAQQELHHHPGPPAALSADRTPLSPTPSTDDDSSGDSCSSSSSSSSSDSPHHSSSSDTDEDSCGPHNSTMALTDEGEGASQSLPSSPPSPPASGDPTSVRRSGRPKSGVDRWSPPVQHAVPCSAAEPASSSRRQRKRTRQQRSHHDDGEHSISSDVMSMEVDSVDNQAADDDADGNDEVEVEVATLVTKLCESYDRRQSVALDSLSKESIVSLRQQVLDEAGDHVISISGQISSLISTSTSLKMVGYFLRATLAHRLKSTSHNCYKRLARDTLGIKSPTDIAAYPALYDFVQHHYRALASASIETWLENPIFSADITWTEWKRYLTKQGRPIIDAALQQFNAWVAPFQDWMELEWVEIYDDEKLGEQGVRALRDIHMPASKAKEAKRDVTASISVVAADLHCCNRELVLSKDTAGNADPTYLVQLDRQRVFDARRHWIGKINHLPDRLCNLKLTSTGKLMQIRPIAAGDALTFDYGVDYWVLQLSGLELSDWLVSSSVQSNRGTLDLFRRMHDSVLDYTGLLSCDWVQRRPAVWSELERETWMGHLVDYLEPLDS